MADVDEFASRTQYMAYLLEKLMATNAFFITAGYGTFFGIWAVSRDAIEPALQVTACLLLLVSAAIFTGWHLFSLTVMNSVFNSIDPHQPGFEVHATGAIHKASVKAIKDHGFRLTKLTMWIGGAGVAVLAVGLLRALA